MLQVSSLSHINF